MFVGESSKSVGLAKKHVDGLVELYGKEGVIFVNLVNMKKDEQTLGIKFKVGRVGGTDSKQAPPIGGRGSGPACLPAWLSSPWSGLG